MLYKEDQIPKDYKDENWKGRLIKSIDRRGRIVWYTEYRLIGESFSDYPHPGDAASPENPTIFRGINNKFMNNLDEAARKLENRELKYSQLGEFLGLEAGD